ncbi:dTDP-glucose 4,6-dehydratase [Paenibacillaceae bacterium WGS1546]|uniref:dTDP-glucose 4,6-dehydratase n=1 Tax=Cohnella sp. WGS1546 TaxID=3366810 RepID=UPI00372D7DA4
MKTYLITGGAGFIGSNFVKYMLKKYNDEINLIVLDKLTYAGNIVTLGDVSNRIKFYQGDICDTFLVQSIFDTHKIDYVINFAAESHVDRSIEDPHVFLKTNILGTQNLLDVARTSWMIGEDSYKEGVKFLQISTDEVYGSLGQFGYFTEETPLAPRSPYSASKASADLIVQAYMETYNIPVNITRCSNNYGPYHFPEKLIPMIIKKVLTGEDVPVYGDGLNVRDWLYVEDHCKAIDIVLHSGKIGEVYNIGGHNERQNIQIVKLIIDLIKDIIDRKPEYRSILKTDLSNVNYNLISYVKDRKGHDRRYAIDPTKIEKELNWHPETNFEEGIALTVEWYLSNQNWVSTVLRNEKNE